MKIKNLTLKIESEDGVVIVVILLIVAISLAIGLSIASRSVTELSISSKIEDSSRAFFAAEGGIEKALRAEGTPIPMVTLTNQSTSSVSSSDLLPRADEPLVYPPIGKNLTAQFWLANPATLAPFYTQASFYIYFGNCGGPANCPAVIDEPAVAVNVITESGGSYSSNKYYFDSKSSRVSSNNFTDVRTVDSSNCLSSAYELIIYLDGSTSEKHYFYCKVKVGGYLSSGTPIMVRVRPLYAKEDQKIALGTTTSCSSCPIPPQARVFVSTGTAGSVQRKLRFFKQDRVLPAFLDYALFSHGDVIK